MSVTVKFDKWIEIKVQVEAEVNEDGDIDFQSVHAWDGGDILEAIKVNGILHDLKDEVRKLAPAEFEKQEREAKEQADEERFEAMRDERLA